jgi:hypothetical protein
MVERAVQVKAPAVRHASVSASVSTANASTSHYLVVDVGLQHSSSQTEMPEQPEQPRGKPEPESHPEDSSSQPEQEKSGPEPQSKSPETEEELLLLSPPPVFADCSHYNATPMTSRRRERRRTRVSVW